MMDFAIVQPPIWTNMRTPWEIGYLKSYLRSMGREGRAYDLSLEVLPLLRDFAEEVDAATGSTFESEVFTASINFLTTISEHLLIRMLYGDATDDARRATAALLSVRTAWSSAMVDDLAGIFMNTPFYPRAADSLVRACERIVAARPRVVGAVTHITSFGFGAFVLREIKRLDPSISTVLSGYQATVTGKAALERLPWVDFVTVGEQETAYRDLLADHLAPRQVIRVTEPLSLDAIPPADYSDLDMTKYQWISLRASRNCPYHCAYCQENAVWDRFRVPAVEHIVDEVEAHIAQYPQRHFDFIDSEMTSYAGRFAQALLDRGVDVEWSGWMRPATRTREYISTLTASGCKMLTFGLESASKRLLATMGRLPHGTPENIGADLESCAKHGIGTCLTAIAGFPGETDDDWQMTLDFFREHVGILDLVGLQSFKALPLSPIAAELRKRRIPELDKVEPLLYALNYDGTPAQRATIEREIHGRRVLCELGLAGRQRRGLLYRPSRRDGNVLDLR